MSRLRSFIYEYQDGRRHDGLGRLLALYRALRWCIVYRQSWFQCDHSWYVDSSYVRCSRCGEYGGMIDGQL